MSRSIERSNAAIDGNRFSGSALSARSMMPASARGQSGRMSWIGGTPSGGGFSPVSAAKHVAASCHWSLAGVGHHTPSVHSCGTGMNRKSGEMPAGSSDIGIAHCHPIIHRRPIGDAKTVSGAMHPCAAPRSWR
jgi:hypothetical protein